jgi:hypothetical protein
VAGALIRLAHRIYPPKVTRDRSIHFNGPIDVKSIDLLLQGDAIRRESRGWN